MENKTELEQAAEKYTPKRIEQESFINGAKWQQEQMYSEAQLKEYGEFCVAKFNGFKKVTLINEYFEQFKK